MNTPRLKVLMSAYACEPGKGSEPEVGWQWALRMSELHEVTVLTRANNRNSIENALQQFPRAHPLPRFVYHELGRAALALKQRFHGTRLYYVRWQKSARALVASLHAHHRFDLLHHTTFATFRYPAAVFGHGSPSVWGPVGGIETVPAGLLPWSQPRSLAGELSRNLANLLQRSPLSTLRWQGLSATVALASTPEMQRAFQRFGIRASLMPAIGIDPAEVPFRERAPSTGPLRALYVGNLLALKGLDLAVEALRRSATGTTLTIVGSGDQRRRLETLAAEAGLAGRVSFRGRLPREEVLGLYADFDLFIFPSLHDTGGYAVLEAMLNQLPVICLDCGGPAVAVSADCGFRIPVGPRDRVIQAIASALSSYHHDRALLQRHGTNARQRVIHHYAWSAKTHQMNDAYHHAVQNVTGQ